MPIGIWLISILNCLLLCPFSYTDCVHKSISEHLGIEINQGWFHPFRRNSDLDIGLYLPKSVERIWQLCHDQRKLNLPSTTKPDNDVAIRQKINPNQIWVPVHLQQTTYWLMKKVINCSLKLPCAWQKCRKGVTPLSWSEKAFCIYHKAQWFQSFIEDCSNEKTSSNHLFCGSLSILLYDILGVSTSMWPGKQQDSLTSGFVWNTAILSDLWYLQWYIPLS